MAKPLDQHSIDLLGELERRTGCKIYLMDNLGKPRMEPNVEHEDCALHTHPFAGFDTKCAICGHPRNAECHCHPTGGYPLGCGNGLFCYACTLRQALGLPVPTKAVEPVLKWVDVTCECTFAPVEAMAAGNKRFYLTIKHKDQPIGSIVGMGGIPQTLKIQLRKGGYRVNWISDHCFRIEKQ